MLTFLAEFDIIYIMKIQIVDRCPSCNSNLVRVTDQLFCRNSNCPAQGFQKVRHYAATLKIKGLGDKTIEKLSISCVPEIFFFEEEDLIEVLGEKLGSKLYKEIEESKNLSFADYLAALGIPLIGKETAKKVATVVNSLTEIDERKLKESGIGTKAAEQLLEWLDLNLQDYEDLPVVFTDNKSREYTLTVCISGKLTSFSTKAEASKWLEANDVKVVDSVTNKVSFLIKEDNKHSSKEAKAAQYSIPVVNFNTFKEILNEYSQVD